jgi:hypothetical protein
VVQLTGTENVVGVMTVTTCCGVTVRSGTDTAEAVKKIVSSELRPCGNTVVTMVGLARLFVSNAVDPPG